MASHSKKTLTTITLMETTPEQWGQVPYTVRKEQRDLMLKTTCPDCGPYSSSTTRYILIGDDSFKGYYFEQKEYQEAFDTTFSALQVAEYLNVELTLDSWNLKYAKTEEDLLKLREESAWDLINNRFRRSINPSPDAIKFRETFRAMDLPCPTCANGQIKHLRQWNITCPRPTGYVTRLHKDVKINAHYPAWPQGTTFPSKYDGCDCEACGKTIRKSGTYGVVAKRDDGTSVGMFVGNACIKKFGFKAYKTMDAQAESWAKKVSSRSSSVDDIVIDFYYRSKQSFEGVDITTIDDITY
tara:strand:- start:190 stop:1083 length:894 start_codon:yes stop_codon:yes gene_type:complete